MVTLYPKSQSKRAPKTRLLSFPSQYSRILTFWWAWNSLSCVFPCHFPSIQLRLREAPPGQPPPAVHCGFSCFVMVLPRQESESKDKNSTCWEDLNQEFTLDYYAQNSFYKLKDVRDLDSSHEDTVVWFIYAQRNSYTTAQWSEFSHYSALHSVLGSNFDYKKHFQAGDLAEWESTYLTCRMPWVQSPAPPNKREGCYHSGSIWNPLNA